MGNTYTVMESFSTFKNLCNSVQQQIFFYKFTPACIYCKCTTVISFKFNSFHIQIMFDLRRKFHFGGVQTAQRINAVGFLFFFFEERHILCSASLPVGIQRVSVWELKLQQIVFTQTNKKRIAANRNFYGDSLSPK